MTKTTKHPIDVLVIGAGPVGTALAIDLIRRGLRVRIVDKAAHAFEGSRAKGVQPRTLEVLEDLGALDAALSGGDTYPPLGVHVGPLTIPWRMIAKKRPKTDVPFPNTMLIPQYVTDAALHARLRALDAHVEFGNELVDLSVGESVVTATLQSADGLAQINARYVAGADGGSSKVRRLLNISFDGSTDEQDRMIIADAVVSGLSRRRWHIWPGKRGRFVGACPLPHSDLFQWMMRLAPGEEPHLDKAALTQRIHTCTGDPRIQLEDIRWTSVFRPNIRLASRYRDGRVFILGDAAHVHTPMGAQGLNTGVQDAYNLGWKIAQVLSGADDRLLDTYEAERRPIAAGVLGLSTKKYNALSTLDPSSIQRGKDEQQLAVSYFGGPLAPNSSQRTGRLRVGDRAPDAELVGNLGEQTRLFQTFCGPHFTMIAYGARAHGALSRLKWPKFGAKLVRVFVDVDTTLAVRTGTLLADRSHNFRRAYGVTGDALFLVRPDGHLGHIATGDKIGTHWGTVSLMNPPFTKAESEVRTLQLSVKES